MNTGSDLFPPLAPLPSPTHSSQKHWSRLRPAKWWVKMFWAQLTSNLEACSLLKCFYLICSVTRRSSLERTASSAEVCNVLDCTYVADISFRIPPLRYSFPHRLPYSMSPRLQGQCAPPLCTLCPHTQEEAARKNTSHTLHSFSRETSQLTGGCYVKF